MLSPSRVALLSLLGATLAPLACGSSKDSGYSPGDASTPTDGGAGHDGSLTGDGGDGGSIISNRTLTGLEITPPQVTIDSLNGAAATQQFTAVAEFNDGTTSPVTGASWSRDNPQVGDIAGSGVYTASGTVGGVVKIGASYQGQNATATLTVHLHLQQNPGNVPGSTQTALQGATTPDTTITWAYPYDATVFPRGVGEAPLMWMNGGADRRLLRAPHEPDVRARDVHDRGERAVRLHRGHVAAVHRLDERCRGAEGEPVERVDGDARRGPGLDHRARVNAGHHLLLGDQHRARDAHPGGRHGAGRLPRLERDVPVVPHRLRQRPARCR